MGGLYTSSTWEVFYIYLVCMGGHSYLVHMEGYAWYPVSIKGYYLTLSAWGVLG
jgi:hypothetical protein